MARYISTGPGDNSAGLFWNVAGIQGEANRQHDRITALADSNLEALAERLESYHDTYAGDPVDEGVIKALYTLMPQIQERIESEGDAEKLQSAILSPLEMESGSFLSALAIAAMATGKPLIGYCDGISVTAQPMQPAAELIEEHRALWVASVAPSA